MEKGVEEAVPEEALEEEVVEEKQATEEGVKQVTEGRQVYSERVQRLTGQYYAISKSEIDNLSVLPTSYFQADKSEQLEAIRNRLEQMKSEYPLDLISLLRKTSRGTSFMVPLQIMQTLKTTWTRICNYSDQSNADLARIVQKMIKENCFEDIIGDSTQQADFVINSAIAYEPLKSVLKVNNGVFLKLYLTDTIILSILERALSNKIHPRNLELLRYFRRITGDRRQGQSSVQLSPGQISKLLQLPEPDEISKLEIMYYLMRLFPKNTRVRSAYIQEAFNLSAFTKELRRVSYSRSENIQDNSAAEIEQIVEGKNSSKPLQYLLAEVFFTSQNFKTAINNVHNVIVVLDRVNRFALTSVLTTISDALQTTKPPSKQWFIDTFETRIPSILESINRNLYNAYVQLYNEYLYLKQNESAVDVPADITNTSLLLSDELYIGQHKIPEPIMHQEFEKRTGQRQKVQNKLKFRPSDSEGELVQSAETEKLDRPSELDVLLESTLNGDLTPHIKEMFAFFRDHDQDIQGQLTNIMEDLPNTPEYEQIVATTEGAERRRKISLLFLRASSGILDQFTDNTTLRDVLTPGATKHLPRRPVEAGISEIDEVTPGELDVVGEEVFEGQLVPVEGEVVAQGVEGNPEEAPAAEGEPIEDKPPVAKPPAPRPLNNTEELRLNRFQKKAFSTNKQVAPQPESDKPKTESKPDGLASYLKILKEVDQSVLDEAQRRPEPQEPIGDGVTLPPSVQRLLHNIDSSKNLQEACKHVFTYLREHRSPDCLDKLLQQKEIKYFKNGEHLLLGMFFHGEVEPRANVKTPSDKLLCSFETELGQMQKDYNKYLNTSTCAIDMALSTESYTVILKKLLRTYSRRHLKRTIAHIVQYCTELSDEIVKMICDLCDRERVAFTALEFAQLLFQNNVTISRQSFVKIARVLKSYKDIGDEVPNLYRRYLLANKWEPTPEPIEAYMGNLIKSNSTEKLEKVIAMIKELAAPRKYRFQDNLSAAENTRLETEHKEMTKLISKKTSLQLASVCARYGQAEHSEALFNDYLEGSTSVLSDSDLALSYLCYSNNAAKFRQMLDLQAKRKIFPEQFQNAVKALDLRPRILQAEIEKVLEIFVYEQKLLMPESTVIQISKVIRRSDNLLLFSRFLEHLLRTQPTLTNEAKRLFFRILNQTKEDAGKNYIKGLLDILFEKDKKEERQKYKETWDAEQAKKAKLDEMKKEALSKIEERKKVEQKEEEELMTKHGLKKESEKAVVETKPQQQSKKNKKQKQEQTAKPKTDVVTATTTDAKKPAQPTAVVETPKKQKGAKDKSEDKKDKSVKKETDSKVKTDGKDLKAKPADGKAAQPERVDLVSLDEKKHINSKAIRRGGRNKFFDMAMTEEQLEEQENLLKKKRGGRH